MRLRERCVAIDSKALSVKAQRPVILLAEGLELGIASAFSKGVLHPCYIDTAVLSDELQCSERI
jgi:hypothetical protein